MNLISLVNRISKLFQVTTLPEIIEIRATPGPTVMVGSYLSLDCLAEGTPHPEYAWKKLENVKKNILLNKISAK